MSSYLKISGYFLIGVGISGVISYSATLFPDFRLLVWWGLGFYLLASVLSIVFDDAIAQKLKLQNTPQWWLFVAIIAFLVLVGGIWQLLKF